MLFSSWYAACFMLPYVCEWPQTARLYGMVVLGRHVKVKEVVPDVYYMEKSLPREN